MDGGTWVASSKESVHGRGHLGGLVEEFGT